jgi:hypothetical protein
LPNVIKIKNNGTSGVAPSSLVAGELALNRADGLLYYSNASSAIAAIGDVVDGGVPSTPAALLMHFDNSTADSSVYARTVTTSGTAVSSATQSKFGGYSAYFDGTASARFTAADGTTGSLFAFAGDFTVECWFYAAAGAAYRTLVTRYNGSNNAWILRLTGTASPSALTAIEWYAGAATGSLYSFAATIALNTWHHVAVCRSGSSLRCFLNGTQAGSTQTNSGTMTGGSAGCMIGSGDQSGFEFPFNGYIDTVRIIPSAMYTANFTPSTTAFGQYAAAGSRTQTIKVRGGTAASLASVNPTPAVREPVYETDTRLLKISGDGTTAYNSLGYVRPYLSATDRLLGRSSAGAGAAEEITCTSDARAILGASNVYAARAWVNCDLTSNSANIAGTYTQSGTTISVTTTGNHGLATGRVVYLDFTTGTAADGYYGITVTGATTFTTTSGTSATTSGNVTLRANAIRASGNVSSIADVSTGDFFVNFTTAMSDANYCVVATAGGTANAFLIRPYDDTVSRTTGYCRFLCVTLAAGNAAIDPAQVNIAVFR